MLTPREADAAGRLMKLLGQRYVQHVNRRYRRSGTLWEGRFRSCIVQDEAFLLGCSRYIELNPVRAGMVAHPAEYPWSSYRANAQGEANGLVEAHPLYTALGRQAQQRQSAYRDLFHQEFEPGFADEIRRATNGNFALGSKRFLAEVTAALGRRAIPGKSGRPRKRIEPASGDLFEGKRYSETVVCPRFTAIYGLPHPACCSLLHRLAYMWIYMCWREVAWGK